MKNRALMNRLITKAGIWAVKQVLTSLPVVGMVFKLAFFGFDMLKEIQREIAEELEAVPLLSFASPAG